MMKSIISAAGLFAAAVSAYTPPNGPNPTYGSLLTPNGDVPVVTGQTISVTWAPKTPTDGVTVSLVLCNGPSTNCVRQSSAIVEGVSAAAAQYSWNVPCDLPLGTANTASGYGMLIIVDGTGEFQYSTQFSVVKGASCGAVTTTTTVSSSSTTVVSSSSTSSSMMSSSRSSSTMSSPSLSYSATNIGSSWIQWSGSVSSTTLVVSSTPVPVVVSTTVRTTAAPVPASTTYVAPTTTAAVSARPASYTGAAAIPSAFVNVFAAVGAAGLAVLAL